MIDEANLEILRELQEKLKFALSKVDFLVQNRNRLDISEEDGEFLFTILNSSISHFEYEIDRVVEECGYTEELDLFLIDVWEEESWHDEDF